MKKVLSVVLALVMCLSLLPVGVPARAAGFPDINDISVFVSQGNSQECTMTAQVNIMRRKAILARNSHWDEITRDSVRPYAWVDGAGIKPNYTYIHKTDGVQDMSITMNQTSISKKTLDEKISRLKSELDSHPEGVGLQLSANGNTHAVTVVYYTGTSGNYTFYCVDPAAVSRGITTLTKSTLGTNSKYTKLDNPTQDDIINCCVSLYIITKATITPSEPETYYLNVKGTLNGTDYTTLQDYATVDVYVNGSMVADDVNGYSAQWPAGTTYEIKDIKVKDGCTYHGCWYDNLSGTLSADTKTVWIQVRTNKWIGDSFTATIETHGGCVLTNERVNDDRNVCARPYTGAGNQLWLFTYQSEGYYRIRSLYDGWYLDLQSYGDVANNNVQMEYNGSNTTCAWVLHEAQTVPSTYIFGTKSTSMVMDLRGDSSADGTNIEMTHDKHLAEQTFKINRFNYIDIGDDFYAFIILDEPWKHVENNAGNAQLATDKNDGSDPKQIWHFLKQNNNSYKIVNEYDGGCLDAVNWGTSDGTNVGTCENNDGTAQRWYFVWDTNAFTIMPSYCGLVWTAQGGSTENGTNICLSKPNSSASQGFQVYKLSYDDVDYAALKPTAPAKPTITITPGSKSADVSWTESPEQSKFDNRVYQVDVFKGDSATGTPVFTKKDLTVRTCRVELDAGRYTVRVRSINTKYENLYSDVSESFDVNEASVSGSFSGNSITATVTGFTGSRLIAAVYDTNGRLTDMLTNGIDAVCTDAHYTFVFSQLRSGYTYKLLLVDAKTYKPLCKSWSCTYAGT